MSSKKKQDASIIEIGLFPNTGHQYAFLPFVDDPHCEYSLDKVPEPIIQYCLEEGCQWITSDSEPWIRWRYGRKEDDPGIWVAIETNLGGCDRGGLFRDKQRKEAAQITETTQFDSPYFCSDKDGLPEPGIPQGIKFIADEALIPQKYFEMKSTRGRKGKMVTATSSSSTPPPPPLPTEFSADVSEGSQSVDEVAPPIQNQSTKTSGFGAAIQKLTIWWPERTGKPWDVDLIVDFGNSRSVALLLEHPNEDLGEGDKGFHDIIRPVRFVPRGTDYAALDKLPSDDSKSILDTWFILHETMFSQFDPPHMKETGAVEPMVDRLVEKVKVKTGILSSAEVNKITAETLRVPQMFAEVAPCVVGEEAIAALGLLEFGKGRIVYQSSPKRYAWDTDPKADQFWGMAVNPWNPLADAKQTPALSGYALKFMYENSLHIEDAEADWPIDKPPQSDPNPPLRPLANPSEPAYARCDTIVWMALSFLETAYRQISTNSYREETGGFIPRRFKSVSVTFPSGWTGKELALYRRKWQTAINIFAHTHIHAPELDAMRNEAEKVVPNLYMEVDEGLASQLPIIYGEIRRMGDVGENWLELVGKRSGRESLASARIMTVDVGGGTTDYAILDYLDKTAGIGVDLVATLLYKDGSIIAGDSLVKHVIEELILPQLVDGKSKDDANILVDLFRQSKKRGKELETWKRLLRLLFMPLTNHILGCWASSRLREPLDLGKITGLDVTQVNILNKLGESAGLTEDIWAGDKELNSPSASDLEVVVRSTFIRLFGSLSKLIPVFGVDLVVLTGKPSELPAVRELLEECLPLASNRIIAVKDFPIGEWYPFKKFGRIVDAKTVTACGAALYRALKSSMVPNWNGIRRRTAGAYLRNNCWMRVRAKGESINQSPLYLDNGMYENYQEQSDLVPIPINTRIGRVMIPTTGKPDPVYILRWRNRNHKETNQWGLPPINVVLKRVRSLSPENTEEPEYLELIHAEAEIIIQEGTANEKRMSIGLDDVELKLCTMDGNEHWIDAGCLNMDIISKANRNKNVPRRRRRRI